MKFICSTQRQAKKIAAVLFFTIICFLARAQMGDMKYPLLLIPDSLYTNVAHLSVNNGVAGYSRTFRITPLYSNIISLTDTNFFQYLGAVVFDTTDSVNTTMHGY